MPIYAYRCESCGHEKDVLRKLSDAPLTQCPACGKDTFSKQVTAAGFQLKGSSWYVTDFRGGNASNAGNKGDAKSEGGPSTAEAALAPASGESSATSGTSTPAADSKPASGTSAA